MGDLAGVTERLPYVAGLGVDGIWLSPFFPSPMRDFGYDVSDHRGVDPLFGSDADFDALIAQAHASGQRLEVVRIPHGHHQMSESPDETLDAIKRFLK